MTEKEDLYRLTATESIQLVVELFNRPNETGRDFGTLMLLNHSLEMLSKAVITGRGIDIRDDDGYSISFKKCINYLENGHQDAPDLSTLDEDQAITLRDIYSQRNEATHGVVEISEQRLHGFARSGLTIFNELLDEFYDEQVADYLPDRVLPLSALPLKRLDIIYQEEYDRIQELLEQGASETARAKLRSIESSERAIEDIEEPPTDDELEQKLERIEEGENLNDLFPGLSGIRFSVDSLGPTVALKLTRSEGFPVREVSEEEAEELEHVIGFREIHPLDRWPFSITKLAEQLEDVNWMQAWAIVRKLNIHGNPDYHDEVRVSDSQTQDRYNHLALERIRGALESGELDPEEAWETHGWI